jgi:cell division protein ZapA
MAKRSVAVRIAGQEYRIVGDESDEAHLQRVAEYVDVAMQRIRERTETVDSLDIAVLAALNLARQVLDLRSTLEEQTAIIPLDRLQSVIELAESALVADALEAAP